MQLLLRLAVCSACLAALDAAQPDHERTKKALHGAGVSHGVKSAFMHPSIHQTSELSVEAAVRSQRLDSDQDPRTKEVLARFGMMEGELEEALEENKELHSKIPNEEVRLSQKEAKFDAKFQQARKVEDLRIWRLVEMGFVAQLVLALALGLYCGSCRVPRPGACVNHPNRPMHPEVTEHLHKLAAKSVPMHPEVTENLQIPRLKLERPDGPANPCSTLTGTQGQPKSCEYFSLAEVEAQEVDAVQECTPKQTPRSSAANSENHADNSDWWLSS